MGSSQFYSTKNRSEKFKNSAHFTKIASLFCFLALGLSLSSTRPPRAKAGGGHPMAVGQYVVTESGETQEREEDDSARDPFL